MFEDIYNIFKVEMDGEEFDSDDDALSAMISALNFILRQREWKFLNRTQTLTLGSFDLSAITDLDKVQRVWYNENELIKAERDQRFDRDYDYWIDYPNLLIVPVVAGDFTLYPLVVDYKMKPATLTLTNDPITVDGLNEAVAYQMCLAYYRKDQDLTTYKQLEVKAEDALDSLIAYNENL